MKTRPLFTFTFLVLLCWQAIPLAHADILYDLHVSGLEPGYYAEFYMMIPDEIWITIAADNPIDLYIVNETQKANYLSQPSFSDFTGGIEEGITYSTFALLTLPATGAYWLIIDNTDFHGFISHGVVNARVSIEVRPWDIDKPPFGPDGWMDVSEGPLVTVNPYLLPSSQAPSVTVQSPNGGEYWRETQSIRWTGTDPQDDLLTYTVYYSPDGGQTWTYLFQTPTVLPSKGVGYNWNTTVVEDGTNYLIKVEASDGVYTGVDVSDAPFAIVNLEPPNTAPTVRVVQPNGGEHIRGTYELQWEAHDPDGDPLTFTVFYSPNGGQTWIPLARDVLETSYQWDTSEIQIGTTYLIKVEVRDEALTAEDQSDAPFAIERETTPETTQETETSPDAVFIPSFGIVEVLFAIFVLVGLEQWQSRRTG